MELCDREAEHEAALARLRERVHDDDLTIMCDLFRLLSEPSRLRIILALTQGELCVYHIAEAVGGNQSAVSHQLRILKDNRLVKAKREGKHIVYSFYDDHVSHIIETALEHVACERR